MLRVSAKLEPYAFDLEGLLDRVEVPLIGLKVEGRGFIEFLLDGAWRFDFVAPDAERASLEATIGKSSSDDRTYEFGEIVAANKRDGSGDRVLFMEIVRKTA
jgi:hypothetical protein